MIHRSELPHYQGDWQKLAVEPPILQMALTTRFYTSDEHFVSGSAYEK